MPECVSSERCVFVALLWCWPPTAYSRAPLHQPVKYFLFFPLNIVNRLQLFLSGRQFSVLPVFLSLHPTVAHCFSPASVALTLPRKDSCSCLPCLSSNPHIVRHPLVNSPVMSPVGLVKVRSRSKTLVQSSIRKHLMFAS